MPANRFFRREKIASDTAMFRQIPSTTVPPSACRGAKAICSPLYRLRLMVPVPSGVQDA
jgi:hypothetical protein